MTLTIQSGRKSALTRRGFLTVGLGTFAVVALAACSASPATPTATSGAALTAGPGLSPTAATKPVGSSIDLRIGYQKGGVLVLLKGQKALEQRFGSKVNVSWLIFTSGPPLLEALHTGSLDFGTTGDTPPIFAQAAGTPLDYVGSTVTDGSGSGTLVPASSTISSIKDLAGKKIAFTKGSASHLLIVRTLEKAGLKYSDIQPAYLQPPDARAAFQGGSVDAWTIWDPFYSAAQQELKAKVLIDGKDVSPTRGFYLASQSFVKDHTDLVRGMIEELQKGTTWARQHPDEYAKILSDETGVSVDVWKQAMKSQTPDVTYIDDAALSYQQNVADTFFQLGLIPAKLDIHQTSWLGGE
jgi:sulfonate transport system substrate-binding protein